MNYLVLCVQGKNSNTLVSDIAKSVKDCRCNIVDGHMTVMGNEFTGMMMLSGKWDAIAKMEDVILKLEKEHQLRIISSRTEVSNTSSNLMPYVIDVVSINKIGVLFEIADFVTQNNLVIQEINTSNFRASNTGAEMFSLHMAVNIPADISIASIRGDFIDFCDRLNIDAIMEPVK